MLKGQHSVRYKGTCHFPYRLYINKYFVLQQKLLGVTSLAVKHHPRHKDTRPVQLEPPDAFNLSSRLNKYHFCGVGFQQSKLAVSSGVLGI